MLESVWNGKDNLTESLERDYADMKGEGWDVVWMPPSPLTTPWEVFIEQRAGVDPDQFVATAMERPKRTRRSAQRILKDWTKEYTGDIAQVGRHR